MKTSWTMTVLMLAALAGCGHTASRHASASHAGHAGGHQDDDDDEDDDDEDDDDEDDDDEDDERVVAMADVPRAVLDAARKAFPAAVWTSAEAETEGGVLVYELSGTLDGDRVEIEITADGKVLEFERS